jgi:hypothetical protein
VLINIALLWDYTVLTVKYVTTFRMTVMPPSSGSSSHPFGLREYKDGASTVLQNGGKYLPVSKSHLPTRLEFSSQFIFAVYVWLRNESHTFRLDTKVPCIAIGAWVLTYILYAIWGFRRDADEICVLLGYYAASNGNTLPTFRDNVSVPSSRVKKSKKNADLMHFAEILIRYIRRITLETTT